MAANSPRRGLLPAGVTAVDATARRVTNIAQAFRIDSHSVIVNSGTVTVTIPVTTGTPVTG